MSRTGIINYGMGNLHSVVNALHYIGVDCFVSDDEKELSKADNLILPGVGAFPLAIKKLTDSGMDAFIKSESTKKPLLGICLGMQLLFENSYEFTKSAGLAIIKGDVVKLTAGETNRLYKIPHIGYNSLEIKVKTPLLNGISDGDCFYFVHSFMGVCSDKSQLLATTDYGEEITAIVGHGYAFGVQFHPEKSGDIGLTILKNFTAL